MADDYYAAMNSMFEVGSMVIFCLALMVRLMPSMINDSLDCCCDPATMEIDFYFFWTMACWVLQWIFGWIRF